MEWSFAHVWLEQKGREIVEIPGDGLCFLRSMQHTLGIIHGEKYSIEEMKNKIISEVRTNPDFYQDFLVYDPNTNVVEELENFFLTKFFATDCVDILIGASLNAFQITLWIFQEDSNGNFQTVQYSSNTDISKRRHVHMILYHDKNDPRGLGNHYNSVVNKSKNKSRCYVDFGSENPGRYLKPTRTSPRKKQTELRNPKATTSSLDESPNVSQPPSPRNVPTPLHSPSPSIENVTPRDDTLHDFSNDPDASMYNLQTENERVLFPEHIFEDVQPQEVNSIPYNIDGNHTYAITTQTKKWHKLQEDGRWFVMHSSTVRNSNMVRKTGKCMGSYQCNNNDCPKFTSGKGRNTYAFTRIGFNLYECKTCGGVAEREFCGAMKLTKFYPDLKKLEVAYAGTHKCNLKVRAPYTTLSAVTKKDVLRPILQKNPKASLKQISEEAAEYFLRMGKPEMAKESVRLAQDKRLISKMKQEVLNIVSDKDPNSFTAVAALREQLKEYDPFLIYKVNDGSFNDEISYVFKSSTCAAELAIEMDCEDPENKSCLKDEPVYCDTMHSRVDKYKNITAWVKNPITRCVMRIATMEVENENTESLTLFFKLLNEILEKVSGKPRYKFNPFRFYVDEAGANINAISNVFGKKGLSRVLGCQWHFLKCAQAKAQFVKLKHTKSFIHLCRRLINAHTRDEYDCVSAALRRICADSNLLDWFLWWDERRFHIVPAFRGFNLSGTNLAESGQSGMKPKTCRKLKLVDAAYKDAAQMLCQDEAYRAYIGNISKEIGKGLNIRQIQERDRRSQEERAKQYAHSLFHGDLNSHTDVEEDDDAFCPTDRARHRAPRFHSQKNPTEKKFKGLKRKKTTRPVIEDDETDASSIHSDEKEDVPEFIDEDYVDSVSATKIIELNATIKKCYSCGVYFNHQKMVPPYNLIFSRKTKRMRPDGKGGQIRAKIPTNAFFCARDMACLELEFPHVEKKHIYMGNMTFNSLTRGHKKFLVRKGYWDAIVHNRRLRASFQ